MKLLDLFSIMVSAPYLMGVGVGTLIQGIALALRGRKSMFFEKLTDIFVSVLAVIAVIVTIPLAIVLMPFILIGAVVTSCFDKFHDYKKGGR